MESNFNKTCLEGTPIPLQAENVLCLFHTGIGDLAGRRLISIIKGGQMADLL